MWLSKGHSLQSWATSGIEKAEPALKIHCKRDKKKVNQEHMQLGITRNLAYMKYRVKDYESKMHSIKNKPDSLHSHVKKKMTCNLSFYFFKVFVF